MSLEVAASSHALNLPGLTGPDLKVAFSFILFRISHPMVIVKHFNAHVSSKSYNVYGLDGPI